MGSCQFSPIVIWTPEFNTHVCWSHSCCQLVKAILTRVFNGVSGVLTNAKNISVFMFPSLGMGKESHHIHKLLNDFCLGGYVIF